MAGLKEVPEFREMEVDGVEQPEVGDVRRPELGEAEVLLTADAGQHAALGGQDLNQAPGDGGQVIAGREIEQRRHEMGVQVESPGPGSPDAGHRQRGAFLPRIAFRQQAIVLAGHLHGLFSQAGVFVAHRHHFGQVTGVGALVGDGNIEPGMAVIGNRQVDVERILVRRKRAGQGYGGRRRLGSREVEQQAIGEDSGGFRNPELTRRERLPADLERDEAPGIAGEGLHPEFERTLDETVLRLEVLRAQEGALHPDYRLESLHRISS